MMAAFFLFAAFIMVAPIQAHAAEGYTVSGIWVFNEVLNLPSTDIRQSVNFSLPNSSVPYPDSFTSLLVTNSGFLYYGTSNIGPYSAANGWQTTYGDVQTFDFGVTSQTVSEEFYTWLNANATFQAPPPDPGPLVEVVTDLQDQKILEQVLVPILAILPIGLVCLVGYKGLRKALDLLRGILHQA